MEKVILLRPYFSHTIWGGKRLREEFGYDEPGDDIGECWGISAHPSGESVAASGEYNGTLLSVLWDEHRELFGDAEGDRFPLLVKIIDACKDLSIQVHPDDAYASEHENGSLGKKECWYVLDCPEDGELVAGHNAGSRDELIRMIDEGKWDDLIRRVKIKPGDAIQIDPGTVHAITAGVCVLETQQSSDITYRLYDYGRLQNGKPRPLHLSQSKDVISVPAPDAEDMIVRGGESISEGITKLIVCDKYTVSRVKVNGKLSFETDADFINASVIKGEGRIFDTDVRKGSHAIITAEGAKNVELSGDMELIISRV
ncbi:MAG: class I mannose-6-phosphate isomerase [Lachnospiraceae bacterium]|nr:class I mannose-6-phosphate isomerase [Lachnospiraceae bacterium]